MRSLIFLFTSALFLSACRSSETTENDVDSSVTYELQKQDSLTVKDILARVFLFQGSLDNRYLFRDMASAKVYLFNRDGSLESQWDKDGDVPGRFGMASTNTEFTNAGDLVLVDIMEGIRVLKADGDVVNSFKPYQTQYSLGSLFSLFSATQVIQKEGEEFLLYSLDIIDGNQKDYNSEFLKKRKSLLLANLETNETKEFLPFPEGSKFLNGNVFFFADIRPVFTYVESTQTLYLMYEGDQVLYTYDWSGDEPVLIEKKSLDLEGFVGNDGFDEGVVSMGQISKRELRPFPSVILNVSSYKGDLLITYQPSPKDKGEMELSLAGNASDELKAKLREEIKFRTVLLKSSGELIQLNLPEMYYQSFKVVNDQIIWMKKPDPDVEAEDFTVYWGELKISEIQD